MHSPGPLMFSGTPSSIVQGRGFQVCDGSSSKCVMCIRLQQAKQILQQSDSTEQPPEDTNPYLLL